MAAARGCACRSSPRSPSSVGCSRSGCWAAAPELSVPAPGPPPRALPPPPPRAVRPPPARACHPAWMAQSGVSLPAEFDSRRLLRRTLQIAAILAAVALLVTLAPGLGQVRHLLDHASPGWIVAAVALEVLSCVSYVVMFRPIFCERMSRRTS